VDLTSSSTLRKGTNDPVPSAKACSFEPKDEYNSVLDANVHPKDYINPSPIEM
jgi:hypothetical protein